MTSANERSGRAWPVGPFGLWCTVPGTYVSEIVARCGFDWLCVDLQHGFMTLGDLLGFVQTADITQTPVLVRIEYLDSRAVHRVLDAGARGVIFPTIGTAQQAADAVAMCRYPPNGRRSWGPARLALVDAGYNPERADDEVLVIIMVESRAGLDNLDEILAVPGIDAILVGPSDLGIALGVGPQADPLPGPHVEALETIARRTAEAGLVPMAYAVSAAGVAMFRELGYEVFGVSSDARLLRGAATALVENLRTDDRQPTTP
ncbi:MAG TPA: aldolase/citrate lyase family protein [Solirubrobacteraceae bacterium]|nr:aldolase/citrate lyase family protein [Solirubrobacteraceae bacterium]